MSLKLRRGPWRPFHASPESCCLHLVVGGVMFETKAGQALGSYRAVQF